MPVWHSSHFGTNFGKEWCASCHPLLCRSNSLWWLIAGILLLLGYVTWPVKKKDMVLIPKSALSGDIWLPVFLGENKSRNWVIFFCKAALEKHGFLQVLLSVLLHQRSGTSGNKQSPCFFCERFYPSELTLIYVKTSPFTTHLISCFTISPWHSCLCFHYLFIFTYYFHPATNPRSFKSLENWNFC